MSEMIQSVKGMHDLLPDRMHIWNYVEDILRNIGWKYGYQEIRTPILEKTELFHQSIGDHTDVVEKEMYTFCDTSDEKLSLRPEATAGTVRACNQHGLLHNQQRRLWYLGPMFRRERPQKGRYRQFHQFGIEAFGWEGPDIDSEVIHIGARIWKELKISDIVLMLNTLGNIESRATYRMALIEYFTRYKNKLSKDSLERLHKNPLRILDSKFPEIQELINHAPTLHDYLDTNSRKHLDSLCDMLVKSGINPVISKTLVRGLDYYTSTVFEWISNKLGSKSAIGAGGRYDQLAQMRRGKSIPAIGFALGLERTVDLISMRNTKNNFNSPNIYILQLSELNHLIAIKISEKLRDKGFRVVTHFGGGTIKSQMKKADQSGADIAIVFENKEKKKNIVLIKLLREEGVLYEVRINDIVDWCTKYSQLKKNTQTGKQTSSFNT